MAASCLLAFSRCSGIRRQMMLPFTMTGFWRASSATSALTGASQIVVAIAKTLFGSGQQRVFSALNFAVARADAVRFDLDLVDGAHRRGVCRRSSVPTPKLSTGAPSAKHLANAIFVQVTAEHDLDVLHAGLIEQRAHFLRECDEISAIDANGK